MEKSFLLLTICLVVLSSLSAQLMWTEEVVLRESNVFDWSNRAVAVSGGGVYTLILEQV